MGARRNFRRGWGQAPKNDPHKDKKGSLHGEKDPPPIKRKTLQKGPNLENKYQQGHQITKYFFSKGEG